jgi:hypothetical protein
LIGKWRAAHARYRRSYPSQTIPSKKSISGSHTRTSTRTLPNRYAVSLLQRTLVPWALEQLRAATGLHSRYTSNEMSVVSVQASAQQPAGVLDTDAVARQIQLDSMLQSQLSHEENLAEEAEADVELQVYHGSYLENFVSLFLQALDNLHYTVDQTALAEAETLEQADTVLRSTSAAVITSEAH